MGTKTARLLEEARVRLGNIYCIAVLSAEHLNRFDEDSFYDERFREEFEAAFPPQNEPAEIAEFIDTYIRSVEEMLATLERLFPHKARTSATEDDQ